MRTPNASAASWFTIIAVVTAELALAAALAYAVAQGYLAYECSHSDYATENSVTCAGGFPYPLY
ncbi:MAG: hypothetical protein ACRDJV_10535 [Actinomycetota bacterium]